MLERWERKRNMKFLFCLLSINFGGAFSFLGQDTVRVRVGRGGTGSERDWGT